MPSTYRLVFLPQPLTSAERRIVQDKLSRENAEAMKAFWEHQHAQGISFQGFPFGRFVVEEDGPGPGQAGNDSE